MAWLHYVNRSREASVICGRDNDAPCRICDALVPGETPLVEPVDFNPWALIASALAVLKRTTPHA